MVKLLLDKGAKATELDSEHRNALDVAADNFNHDCAMEIIRRKEWKKVLNPKKKEDKEEVEENYNAESTMKRLIEKVPSVAKEVFDKCCEGKQTKKFKNQNALQRDFERGSVRTSQESEKKKYYIFKYLDGDEEGVKAQVANDHCLMLMVKLNRADLLHHPLVKRLLKYKWEDKHLRAIFWAIFLIYLLFMIPFNIFIMSIPPPYAINSTNETCAFIINEAKGEWGEYHQFNHSQWIGAYLTIIFAIFNLIKELVQMCEGKLNYFKDPTNWVELTLYTFSIFTSAPMTSYTRTYGVLEPWQWQIGSIAIFLSWMELLLFVENIPKFKLGIYVLMFTNIFKTFIKFSLVLLVFICAFAFSFHVLFQNQVAFTNLWKSVVKTIVIMIGEIDYDSMFNTEEASSEYSDQVYYDAVSYFVFVSSLITMSIIVMNMLVGLAVDDIKAVQNKAESKSRTQHAKLVLETQFKLPDMWRDKFIPNSGEIEVESECLKYLNQRHEKISDDAMKNQMHNLRLRVYDVNKRTQSIESMLKIHMKKNQYEWEDDNDDLDL